MNIDNLTFGEIKELLNMFSTTQHKPTLEQKRVLIVVDRGWVFAGDQSMTSDGYIRLDNCVHVFGWREIGFAKMIEDWKSSKVDIRPCIPTEIHEGSVIFRVPIVPGWGVKT